MYLGDNLLQGGIERPRRRLPQQPARGADPAHAGRPIPRTTASPSCDGDRVTRLEEKPPEPQDRPRAGRRLHVHRRDPRRRARDRALGARRARDHRRDPAARRRGPPRRAAHRRGLVEGHRAASRTCSRPTGSCSTRSSRASTASSTRPPVSTAAWSSRRARRSSARPSAARRSSARARGWPTPTSARTRAIGENCVIERAEVEHSILLDGIEVHDLRRAASSPRCSGATCAIRRDDGQPRALPLLVGDNSEIAVV